MGRLVNHGDTAKKRNCNMRVFEHNGIPLLGLFATRHITPGQEILYDWGVSSLLWKTEVGCFDFNLISKGLYN